MLLARKSMLRYIIHDSFWPKFSLLEISRLRFQPWRWEVGGWNLEFGKILPKGKHEGTHWRLCHGYARHIRCSFTSVYEC